MKEERSTGWKNSLQTVDGIELEAANPVSDG